MAVVGASGFIGRAIAERLTDSGIRVTTVRAPRIAVAPGTDPGPAASQWAAAHATEFARVIGELRGATAVINAAGLATATAVESPDLWGADAVLPGVVGLASVAASTPRFVHVSSAAVQGSRTTLDERPYDGSAHSPYARAKGAGEIAVAAVTTDTGTTAVVYRPPSVLGAERPIAGRLARVLKAGWLVVPDGQVPLPVAHVDHVARAVECLAAAPDPPPIVTHPWETMTTASLASAFGRNDAIRRLPQPLAWPAVRMVRLLARGGPLAGHARRIELLWDGQHQQSSLPGLGFALSNPGAAFRQLGDQLD